MTNKSHREKLDKKIEMVGMARKNIKNITPDDVETLLIKDGLIKLSSSLKK